ncbi:MAG: sugar O-acetyltransferase [Rhodothermales bacterium]|nr:sugar O-acetyltransferase [Rhodothermales bacterium]
MTEREKMLAGLPYDSREAELMALYRRARPFLQRFNGNGYTLTAEEVTELLSDLFDAAEDGVWIEPPFYCDYGAHIRIGAGTFVHTGATMLDSADIEIGRGVLIGPRVTLATASHPLPADERMLRDGPVPRYVTTAQPIRIGDEAWIGANATVLGGVTVGAGAVVAAGAVVTKDVPPRTLVAGVPARIVRAL